MAGRAHEVGAPFNRAFGEGPFAGLSEGARKAAQTSAIIADPTAWRNPGGAFGYGTSWISLPVAGYSYEDAAIKIEGIPEPASFGLLGLGALALLRRR